MPIPYRPSRLSRTVLAGTALAVLVGACGDADDAGTDQPSTDVGGAAPIEVRMVDYTYEGLPSTVPAGTRFAVVNGSATELHELVAFRLPDGEDRPIGELLTLAPPELIGALGGEPVAVLLAAPGGPMIPAVGDGTLAEPGRYAIVCFIPTGADPQEYLDVAAETEEGPPQGVAGGPPHFVNGMAAELTVE
jgi:hypothetical protein